MKIDSILTGIRGKMAVKVGAMTALTAVKLEELSTLRILRNGSGLMNAAEEHIKLTAVKEEVKIVNIL